jgi:hypothetical protein
MTVMQVIAGPGVTQIGQFQGPNTGTVSASTTDGTFTIDSRDFVTAMRNGYLPVYKDTRSYTTPIAPAAASTGLIVNSVALTNTTLSIAAQPDVMRQVVIRVDPGSPGITAGVCTVTYAAGDGTAAQVDILSLVAAANTSTTVPFSKGVMTVASAVVSGLVGGGSPHIQIGVTNTLAVPVPPGSVDVTLLKEITDAADTSANLGTITNAGLWTPHTSPNATHTYAAGYTTIAP